LRPSLSLAFLEAAEEPEECGPRESPSISSSRWALEANAGSWATVTPDALQHGYSGAMIDECQGGAGADIRPPSTGGIHFADFSRCAAGAPGGYAVLD